MEALTALQDSSSSEGSPLIAQLVAWQALAKAAMVQLGEESATTWPVSCGVAADRLKPLVIEAGTQAVLEVVANQGEEAGMQLLKEFAVVPGKLRECMIVLACHKEVKCWQAADVSPAGSLGALAPHVCNYHKVGVIQPDLLEGLLPTSIETLKAYMVKVAEVCKQMVDKLDSDTEKCGKLLDTYLCTGSNQFHF